MMLNVDEQLVRDLLTSTLIWILLPGAIVLTTLILILTAIENWSETSRTPLIKTPADPSDPGKEPTGEETK